MLCFAARDDALTCALFAAFGVIAAVLLVLALRDGHARGRFGLRNPLLLAFAFGLALSLMIGIIVPVVIDHLMSEYVQVH